MAILMKYIKTGDIGVIKSVKKIIVGYRRKLLAMGVLPGTAFKVIRVAPMGDPIQLEIRGFQLSLRRHEAESVEVDLYEKSNCTCRKS